MASLPTGIFLAVTSIGNKFIYLKEVFVIYQVVRHYIHAQLKMKFMSDSNVLFWKELNLKKVIKNHICIGCAIGHNSVVPPGRLIPSG